MQAIRLLRNVLNDSLDTLETAYSSRSLDFPSLDDPYKPNTDCELLATDPEIRNILDKVVSASYQLLCTVRHPFLNLADAAAGFHLASCLRVAEKFNIPEILNSAPAGLHITEVAAKADVEPTKLARILRVLATHHIFREVKPNVFANNRNSSYFSTGKSADDIKSDPSSKYSNRLDAAAAGYIGSFTDEVFKASSYLVEDLEDTKTGKLFSHTAAPLQKAIHTDHNFFSWMEQPGNEYRLARYGACIQGTSLWDPPESILNGYEWSSINRDGLLVDVGGGLGAPSMILAKAFPDLRIVIQDRKQVSVTALQHWRETYPEGLESDRVTFMEHDFFSSQPIIGPSAFLLRTICHDWPDESVVKILTNLRAAATASTRLILADYVMRYACPATESTITGGARSPLLENLGKAGFNSYYIDMSMGVLLNGQERTLSHQTDLAAKAGWRVIQVNQVANSHFGYLIAEPLGD